MTTRVILVSSRVVVLVAAQRYIRQYMDGMACVTSLSCSTIIFGHQAVCWFAHVVLNTASPIEACLC